MRKTAVLTTALLLGTAFSGMPLVSHGQDKQQNEPRSRQNLIREVRHQLVLLPYYSVFDNLSFKVEGDTVILEGQVVRPTLKSDAENELVRALNVVIGEGTYVSPAIDARAAKESIFGNN